MSDDTPPIIVEPVSESTEDGGWTPTIGQETRDFLDKVVPQDSRESVLDDAVSILSKESLPQPLMIRKQAW